MTTKRARSPDKQSRKNQIIEITEKLEAGVKDIFESENYKEYLKCMSKFHSYSLNNCLLISMQYPQASLVAGYRSWQKNYERHVKPGEKAIKILAPCKYKIEVEDNDQEEKQTIEYTSFRVVNVFAYEQTEGKELPTLGVDELIGDVKDYKRLFDALINVCPVPICSENISGGVKGYYDDGAKRIAIKEGMSEMQTIKTMIHEISHQKLHSSEAKNPELHLDRNTKEVEAESIAYTICQHYGIDTADYTFAYVAGWSSGKDVKELKSSLERIRSTADEMITSIDKSMEKYREKNERTNDYER